MLIYFFVYKELFLQRLFASKVFKTVNFGFGRMILVLHSRYDLAILCVKVNFR